MPIRRCSGVSTRNSPPSDQNAWPPRFCSGSWSTSSTRFPASASSAVATSPARPAPTTMTSASIWLSNQATGPRYSQEVRSSPAGMPMVSDRDPRGSGSRRTPWNRGFTAFEHWIRGFTAFRLVRRAWTVRLVVPV